jgi:uncharacterized membrane protein HdeD (DUF308 family)
MAEQGESRDQEPRAWRWFLGFIMTVLGLMAISSATVTGLLSLKLIGLALVMAGFVEVLAGLGRGSNRIKPLRLMGGLLSFAMGGLILLRPGSGLVALTGLLAAYFLAAGLFHAATSLMERYPGWGWDLLYGACAIVLAVVALSNARAAGLRLVGGLVGIEILLRGLALVLGGLQRKRPMATAPKAA